MRTIIAGGRDFNDFFKLESAIETSGWNPSVVISGKAKGADAHGELWAKMNNVPVEEFPADWDKYGKSAGYKRNTKMAENAEALIALWDGKSRGTKMMIDIATKKNLRVHVFRYDPQA